MESAPEQQPETGGPAGESAVADVVWRVVDFLTGTPVDRRPSAAFVDDLEFDSMTVVTLYAICEELFQVDLFDSDAVAGQRTIGDLAGHLAGLVGAGTGRLPDESGIDELLAQYG